MFRVAYIIRKEYGMDLAEQQVELLLGNRFEVVFEDDVSRQLLSVTEHLPWIKVVNEILVLPVALTIVTQTVD